MSSQSLLYISELKGFTFHIDKYQRGYRWGMREIHSLLFDVYEFDDSKEDFYCLQPLVVRDRGDSYELIDGQQRATTIYLILKYLIGVDFYLLKYETRGNEDGFNQFLLKLNEYTIPDFFGIPDDVLEKAISDMWKATFQKKSGIPDSVDNFYIFKAFCIVKHWFQNDEAKQQIVKDNLLHKTKVIWYVEGLSLSNSTNTFINFNDGKISLDQAELIKGLFVLDFENIKDLTRKSYEENQFAEEWNIIEQHLRVPSFWSFVNSEKDNREVANKINLLLELDKGKSQKSEDSFFTYRAYERAFKQAERPEWRNLSALYNQLDEWFQNRETYHLMGAAVHLSNISVHQIIEKYKKSTSKDELINYLKTILKAEFFDGKDIKVKYSPSELKYGKPGVSGILLLYNIAVAQLSDKYYRFPFDLFKKIKSWNIEHIYAKNSSGFDHLADLEDWHKELSMLFEEDPQLLESEDLRSQWKKIDLEDLAKSNEIVKKIEMKLTEKFDKDSLSNLCLLDSTTNIQVSNKVFRKKREMVLEINSQLNEESYIPIATKSVFQKSITPSDNLTLNYWNTYDREAYQQDIENKIKQFLGV